MSKLKGPFSLKGDQRKEEQEWRIIFSLFLKKKWWSDFGSSCILCRVKESNRISISLLFSTLFAPHLWPSEDTDISKFVVLVWFGWFCFFFFLKSKTLLFHWEKIFNRRFKQGVWSLTHEMYLVFTSSHSFVLLQVKFIQINTDKCTSAIL